MGQFKITEDKELHIDRMGFQSYLRRSYPKLRNLTVRETLGGTLSVHWEAGSDQDEIARLTLAVKIAEMESRKHRRGAKVNFN